MKHWKLLVCLLAVLIVSFGAGRAQANEIVVGFSGPLSGPAAEYGQDIFSGIDMAIKEINAAGGITVAGKKYTFRLDRLDDRADPVQAVNNSRRFKGTKAIAVFNGVFNTIVPIMKINEEKGNEFIVMAYTSTPVLEGLGNKLMVNTSVNFMPYLDMFSDWALKKGWKKCAMLVTLGAYGDENRALFREIWTKKGGIITADKPANYYTETDFSAPLAATIATKPDVMFIGGPSATTALVIEQARTMGFKGGFMVIDQAKQDYMAKLLGGTSLMGNLIGTGGVVSVALPAAPDFEKRFVQQYKKMVTWECALNYTGMHALAKAIVAAGTVDDVHKIRAGFDKALAAAPMLGDKYPNEVFGITKAGCLCIAASVQTITNGKLDVSTLHAWWPKTQAEFDNVVKLSTSKKNPFFWYKQ